MVPEDLFQLIKGCVRGDRKSQETVYRMYAKDLYAVCLSYANDASMAQDMLQEGFMKVFRSIKTFDNKGSFEGWVRRIVVNTAIDHLRREKRILNYVDDDKTSHFADDPSVYKHLDLEHLLSFIRQLPEGARTILNLFAVEGYSHKEIAEKLSISVGTSKSQYNRAKHLLNELITNSEGQ